MHRRRGPAPMPFVHLPRSISSVAAFVATALFISSSPVLRSAAAPAPAPAGAAAPALSPAEAFFAPSAFTQPRLSPGGGKLCARMLIDDRHYALTLVELSSKKGQPLIRNSNVSVLAFWWKSEDLILVLVEDDRGVRQFKSLDLKTTKVNELSELGIYQELQLVNELPDNPEDMLFRSVPYNGNTNDLIQVNLRSGKFKKVVSDPGDVQYWLTNRKAEALAGWGFRTYDRTYFLLWRKTVADAWQRKEFPKGKMPDFVPFHLADDQHRLIVRDYRGGSAARLCYYDPATEATEEIVAARDVDPVEYEAWGRAEEIGAIVYPSAPRHLHFLNADAEAADQWLSKAIPDTRLDYHSFSQDNHWGIVLASNDRNPGVYCLVNFETKKVSSLGLSFPTINPNKTSPARAFHFTASDGLNITGHVTLPLGREKPPAILMAGPSINGPLSEGDFDRVAQFFASRGYATIRINHRGTENLGHSFTMAGDFQIHTGIVRDFSEGLQWLGTQGWIDSSRVAVFAEGWGGLSGLHLAAQPGIRALVNFNTPMELNGILMTQISPSLRSEDELVAAAGGKKAAYSYVESIDPMLAVKQLKIPSFHFYGSGRGGSAVGKLRSILKDRNLVCEVSTGESAAEIRDKKLTEWKLEAARYDAAASFLDKYLAAAP